MRLAMRLRARLPAGTGGFRLTGICRFLPYLGLQFCIFMLQGSLLAFPALLLMLLAGMEGFSWWSWGRRSWPVILMAAMPAVVGFPKAPGLDIAAWTPSLVQSARFLMVFASAAWLSRGMSPVELREVLGVLLKPLGRHCGEGVARSASLALAFLPWTISGIRQADEAARLRGSNPGFFPVRHLAAMAVPVSVRALEKARLSAEALELRDPG